MIQEKIDKISKDFNLLSGRREINMKLLKINLIKLL